MGCCALGPQYMGLGRDHWFEMLENPRKPVAQWYVLQEIAPNIPSDGGDAGSSAGGRRPRPWQSRLDKIRLLKNSEGRHHLSMAREKVCGCFMVTSWAVPPVHAVVFSYYHDIIFMINNGLGWIISWSLIAWYSLRTIQRKRSCGHQGRSYRTVALLLDPENSRSKGKATCRCIHGQRSSRRQGRHGQKSSLVFVHQTLMKNVPLIVEIFGEMRKNYLDSFALNFMYKKIKFKNLKSYIRPNIFPCPVQERNSNARTLRPLLQGILLRSHDLWMVNYHVLNLLEIHIPGMCYVYIHTHKYVYIEMCDHWKERPTSPHKSLNDCVAW